MARPRRGEARGVAATWRNVACAREGTRHWPCRGRARAHEHVRRRTHSVPPIPGEPFLNCVDSRPVLDTSGKPAAFRWEITPHSTVFGRPAAPLPITLPVAPPSTQAPQMDQRQPSSSSQDGSDPDGEAAATPPLMQKRNRALLQTNRPHTCTPCPTQTQRALTHATSPAFVRRQQPRGGDCERLRARGGGGRDLR